MGIEAQSEGGEREIARDVGRGIWIQSGKERTQEKEGRAFCNGC